MVSKVEEFLDKKYADGLSETTLQTYRYVFKNFEEFLGFPPEKAEKKDMVRFFSKLRKEGKPQATIATYGRTLKTFYRWLGRSELTEELPTKTEPRVTSQDILTEEELKRMILSCDNPRDRAFISVLWETGVRVGEYCSLNVGSVMPTDYGFRISIPVSKTETRVIPVVKFSKYLAEWLNIHQGRDDPNAPLWYALTPRLRREMVRLSPVGAWRIVKKIAKRAGIEKKVYPHLLRHSRMTDLACQVSESILRSVAGWSKTSKMPSVYVHLSGADVENAILEVEGISKREKKETFKLTECPRCGKTNMAVNKWCEQCGYPLSGETIIPLIVEFQKILEEREKRHLKRIRELEENYEKMMNEMNEFMKLWRELGEKLGV